MYFMVLTAVLIGALLEGITKCRSITNNFLIKEKLPGQCTKLTPGSFTSDHGGKVVMREDPDENSSYYIQVFSNNFFVVVN